MLTPSLLVQLIGCSPPAADAWASPLDAAMGWAQISTPRRIACFLGTIKVETGGLSRLSENLNYSAARLPAVWPSRFHPLGAPDGRRLNPLDYARNPERLANAVYANRMGNGPVESGDGWRFRGRGAPQLTGRDAYVRAGLALRMDLVADPDKVLRPRPGAMVAAWFWSSAGKGRLPVLADGWELEEFRRIWNGGALGLEEFREAATHILEALQ